MEKKTPITDGATFYVAPNIQLFTSIANAVADQITDINPFMPSAKHKPDFAELAKTDLAFVIGEPGNGKSVFMRHLADAVDAGRSMLFDCRSVAGEMEASLGGISANVELVCFDGLDEVPPLEFVVVLDRIRQLLIERPELRVFISCRIHYITRFTEVVKGFSGAEFIRIFSFDGACIREYLEHYLSDEKLIGAIIDKSRGSDSEASVLRTPRYLEALVRSIIQSKMSAEEILKMGRAEIFEKVIYFKLISDVEKQFVKAGPINGGEVASVLEQVVAGLRGQGVGHNEVHLTQRVLEKLAFIMEIYQRNRISKAELVTFLDDTTSNINLIFLSTSSIDTFIERTLKSVEFDHIEFENTEFQEYLAAKELVRMASSEQVLYDLILHPELRIIFVNWYEVVDYALELEPKKLIGGLAAFVRANPEKLHDERLSRLLMGTGVWRADEELRAQLFEALMHYYQHNGSYVYHYADSLARLFSINYNSDLVKLVELQGDGEADLRRFINKMMVCGAICRLGMQCKEIIASWKPYLLSCLTDKRFESRSAIYWALEPMDSLTELMAMKDELLSGSEKDITDYLACLSRVSADSAIDIFIEAATTMPLVEAKDDFIDRLNSEAAISKILQLLIDKPHLWPQVLDNEYSMGGFHGLFGSIAMLGNTKLDVKISKLFMLMSGDTNALYQRGSRKEFMDRSLGYLLERDPGLIDLLLQRTEPMEFVQEFATEIVRWMDRAMFEKIREASEKTGLYEYYMRRIVHQLDTYGPKAELREELAALHPELFASTVEDEDQTLARERKKDLELLERFRKERTKAPDMVYNQRAMTFYAGNEGAIVQVIEDSDMVYIKGQLLAALEQLDPEVFNVSSSLDGTTVSFSVNDNRWFQLSTVLHLAIDLEEKQLLDAHREKIFKYLPMVNDNVGSYPSLLPRLLDALGGITADDIKSLLDFCNRRSDDYIYVSSKSFAKMIADYRLMDFKPILKLLIESGKSFVMDRETAIMAFGELAEGDDDRQYLHDRFTSYQATFPTLAEAANEALVLKYLDDRAIAWRFGELERRAPQPPVAVDAYEWDWDLEMDRHNLASCFWSFEQGNFDDQMLSLLRYALSLRLKGGNHGYSRRMMKIVAKYFSKYNSFAVISKIGAILSEKAYVQVSGSFREFLRQIEFNYAKSHQLYRNISEPIRIYNVLKSKAYLPLYDHRQLMEVIDAALGDLSAFIMGQGYGTVALQLSGTRKAGKTSLFNEDILQKTLKVYLENALLRRGLRESDLHREVQLFDNKRLDLLISYGFIGPIMAELKLLHNPEIQDDTERAVYKDKMRQYISGTNARASYYVVFRVNDDKGGVQKAKFDLLINEYADIRDLKIVLIDCVK